jgi:hypothetical protein
MSNGMANQLTVPEKILSCAVELDQEKGTFSAEDLVVRCWERFPDTFGLQGYADSHPDANRVLTNIMGSKGLRGKGWLRKVREKRYRVTEAGRHAAMSLAGVELSEAQRAGSLSRETTDILGRLITSRAVQKYRLQEALTFGDLCSFWNISPRSNAYQLRDAITGAEAAIDAAGAWLESRAAGSLVLPGTTLHITSRDLDLARTLHRHLLDLFAGELGVIRARSDERLPR